MKQKYVVRLDNEIGQLSIQEYAELDKEMLSLLCEETYDAEVIKTAMARDRNALIQALRTNNMYPPGVYTERIADAIIEMFAPDGKTSAELFFEERELFEPAQETPLLVHRGQALLEDLSRFGCGDPGRFEDAAIVVHGPYRHSLVVDDLLPDKVGLAKVAVQVGKGLLVKLEVVRAWPV